MAMIFPSNLFKGKDEKANALEFEKIINEKEAEIEQLKAELANLKNDADPDSISSQPSTADRIPIDISILRNILLNTYNRIDRSNKAPRYSILNLLNVINYTQASTHIKVTAMQEINFIKSYLEVRKHATTERPMIRFSSAPTLRRQYVHSGLFTPIINYAFNNASHGTQLEIKISEIDNAMTMDLIMPQNNLNSAFTALSPEFQNLKKTLDNLYPGGHIFEIKSLSTNIAIRLGIKYEKPAYIPNTFEEEESDEINE